MIRKLITSAALALGLAGAAVAPAQAFHGGGGGFHGGGFHGGGFHGGGFHGGFGGFHGGGFHGGFVNRGFAFRHDRFRRGFFPFFGFGAGLAYAGAYPYYDYYDYPYDYYSCYLRRQWVWNGYRHVYALVRVCP